MAAIPYCTMAVGESVLKRAIAGWLRPGGCGRGIARGLGRPWFQRAAAHLLRECLSESAWKGFETRMNRRQRYMQIEAKMAGAERGTGGALARAGFTCCGSAIWSMAAGLGIVIWPGVFAHTSEFAVEHGVRMLTAGGLRVRSAASLGLRYPVKCCRCCCSRFYGRRLTLIGFALPLWRVHQMNEAVDARTNYAIVSLREVIYFANGRPCAVQRSANLFVLQRVEPGVKSGSGHEASGTSQSNPRIRCLKSGFSGLGKHNSSTERLRLSSAWRMRARQTSRPRTVMVSKSGGAFLRPQTATRMGWNMGPALRPS